MDKVYKNILLPVDGSQQSIDAFKTGLQQANVWDSNVYLVQVLSEDRADQNNSERQAFLDALEDYARKQGVSLHKELVFGDPRTQIATDLVDRWDIDLIVIGATGKGRIAKLLVGSVTSYVVRNVISSLVVKLKLSV